MARFVKDQISSKGKSPGSLVFIGKRKVEDATIKVIDYTQDRLIETTPPSIAQVVGFNETESVSWIDITGLHNTELIGEIGKSYGIHPLILEDILNTGQRPKLEELDGYLFIIVKMMRIDKSDQMMHSEQLSMVIGNNYIFTFQERPGDTFDPVRERLKNPNTRIRRSPSDYLAYALLDTIVDNYLILIEQLGEQIEDVENEILENPGKEVLAKMNGHIRELNYLRKSIRPAKDAFLQLGRLEFNFIHEATSPFIRDLNDHITQAVEAMDTYGEMLHDFLEIHSTNVGNRLNEIMKFLTIFSAIFIPLNLLAAIYGTNFRYIPELGLRYGYFIFLGVILFIGVFMIFVFKRKKWL
ncbi:MAG: magnesium and cobalt transport protein CorA [Spirochaetae bacterium HGW-Spirochaetae-8]|nr:MAG: magnesium and cobalt transport protein CorA [Spirochaetae bacterium HGW-Spirochaetae-8]